jgi:hypothetical protein
MGNSTSKGDEPVNGTALCPRCDAKAKFDRVHDPRPWTGGLVALVVCQGCLGPAFAESTKDDPNQWQLSYPFAVSKAPEGCPDEVRVNFEEALLCWNAGAFRAAVLMARSALQACMRDKSATGNDLKSEIRNLAKSGVLTTSLADWADEVRVGGNLAAHPKPGSQTEPEDADELIPLARSIFEFVYTMPFQIQQRRNRQAGS